MKELVTVVAICYNQAQFLLESLDSIKNQTLQGFDFHVIDDCSTDNSVELIKNWVAECGIDVTVHVHESNQGITKTMNHALRLCTTKYFQPWPCDDIMLPQKLEKQIAYLESLAWTPGFLYGDCQWIDDKGNVFRNSVLESRKNLFEDKKMPEGNLFLPLLEHGCFIPTASGIYVTEPLKKLGGFDENLWAEDWDMFMALSLSNGIAFQDELVSKYRRHATSAEVTRGDKYWDGHFQILYKYLDKNPTYKKIIWSKIYSDAQKASRLFYAPAKNIMLKAAIQTMNMKGIADAIKPIIEQLQPVKNPNVILVTGMPRSGTTWLGNVLAKAKSTNYVFEPFNISVKMNAGSPVKNWFETLNDFSTATKRAEVKEYVDKKCFGKTSFKSYRPKRVVSYLREIWAEHLVVKDPLAIFSLEWYNKTYKSKTIIMVRHPAALVSSYKDHGWGVDFNDLLGQPEWCRRFPLEATELTAFLKASPSHLERNAFLWKLIYQIVDREFRPLPDVLIVKHEDLLKEPLQNIKPILHFLKLANTNALQQFITTKEMINTRIGGSDASNFDSKYRNRLSAEEIETIKRITSPVWKKHYRDEDW